MTTRTLHLVRHLDASRAEVWRAWTEPDHLRWFSDTEKATEVDLRVGGSWRQFLVVHESLSYWTGGRYTEVETGSRLAFVWGAERGWPDLAPKNGEDCPVVTIDLYDSDEGTKLDFALTLPDALTEEEVTTWIGYGIRDGWDETLDRLEGAMMELAFARPV